MREAGRRVAEVLVHLREAVAPGVSTGDLDALARERIAALGGQPSFLGYQGFPASVCVSVDEEVVHGIPGRVSFRGHVVPDRSLRSGQLVSIDCGVVFEGYHGDGALTLAVGSISPEKHDLLEAGRAALWAGLERLRPGARVSDIARGVQGAVARIGLRHGRRYGIVRDYSGHGIGRSLHEEPTIPNVVSSVLRHRDCVLRPGLVLAIEPMLSLGTHRTRLREDGWTVVTRDGRPSCHFEHTVAVTETGFEVLTRLPDGSLTH